MFATNASGPIKGAVDLDDVRDAARRRLPRVLFDFIDGGSEGEQTLRANARQFDDFALRPRQATQGLIDTKVELFGEMLPHPILIAPCGSARMIHRDGELGIARAAAATGTRYVLPHMGATTAADIAAGAGVAPWYQLYKIGGRAVAEAAIEWAAAAGCRVLVITIDNGAPMRARDVRNGLAALNGGRLRPLLPHLPQLLARPGWLAAHLRHGGQRDFPNAVRNGRAMRLPDVIAANRESDSLFVWDDLEWIRARWPGALVVKSVLTAADAQASVGRGADGIIVSNHGGRGLDGAPPTMRALPEIVAAVGEQIPVLLDGGVRRGGDVVKALASGARAVLVGRPVMFGLAFGESGVRQVLDMLLADLRRTLVALGRPTLADIDGSALMQIDCHG